MRKILRVKRVGVVLGVLLFVALALIGVLSITRGTPVKAVVAIGDKEGPPAISDSLFARSMALYTGLQLTRGNAVQQMLNGNGLYPPLWRDLRSAKHTIKAVSLMESLAEQVRTIANFLNKALS